MIDRDGLKRRPGYAWALALLTAMSMMTSANAENVARQFQFGETIIQVDPNLLMSSRVRNTQRPPSEMQVMSRGTSLDVKLPPTIEQIIDPSCNQFSSVDLVYGTTPRRAERPLFGNVFTEKTAFDGIDKLVPSTSLSLYQFSAPDLRDHWSEPITFARVPPLIHLGFQVTQDLRVLLVTSDKPCVLQNAERLTRAVKQFIRDLIQSDK